MSRLLATHRHILVTALVAALAFSAGAVFIARAESTAIIYACVKNNNGDVHIVQANENCKNNETKISWNQQGPQGPPGPAGGGISEVVSVQSDPATIDGDAANDRRAATATCPAGKTAVGGGAKVNIVFDADPQQGTRYAITDNYPVGNPATAWTARALVFATYVGTVWTVEAYAICQ